MSQRSNSLPPEAGSKLDGGRVTLDAPLGAGGMGSVFRGRLRDHDGPVAVKLLRVEGVDPAERATMASRLRDEATAAARVVHPNLVRILGSGDCLDYGPYIVYELVEGGSLEERLKGGPLPWEEVEERLAPQLLGALGALHAAGIVHRDVKPDNLFISGAGRYLLGDLGLAVFDGRSAATATGVVVGTPGYLAPERITRPANPPTPAGDVYAAAMVLVRAAAGRLPFAAASPAALVNEQLRLEIAPHHLCALGLPRRPAIVLAVALARDPGVRPPSAEALRRELSRFETCSRGLGPTLTIVSAGSLPGKAADDLRAFPGRRRPFVVGLFLMLALVALLVGGRPVPPSASTAGAPSAYASLAASLSATSPLVEDLTTDRLQIALARLEPAALSGDPGALDELRAMRRAVGRAAATTSPVFILVDDVVTALGRPVPDPVSRRERLCFALMAYANRLRASPVRAGSCLRLLVLLTARVSPFLLAEGVRAEPGGPLDEVAVGTYGVLACLPGKVRRSPAGRSLSAVLDLLLSRATPSGSFISPVAGESLALLAADPTLLPEVGLCAAALDVPPAATWSPALVDLLAAPALARRQVRRVEVADLRSGRFEDMVKVVGEEGSPEVEATRGVVTRAVEDWYRVVPLADPGGAGDARLGAWDLWSLGSDIVLRGVEVRRLPSLAPLSQGPFRLRPLAGRTSVMMAAFAERGVDGDVEALALVHREVDDWVHGLALAGLIERAPFVGVVRGILERSPRAASARLLLDSVVAVYTGNLVEAASLASEACSVALNRLEQRGMAAGAEDLQAVSDCLSRLQRVVLSNDARVALRSHRERTTELVARLRARGASDPVLATALDELTLELGKPLSQIPLFEEAR